MTDLVLGFDFGKRRIGVAVGQSLTGSASAHGTFEAIAGAPDWGAIEAVVAEWKPTRLLVGRPANMDGTDSAMTGAAEAFAEDLGQRTGLPVALVDERLTSFEAREHLRDQRRAGVRNRRVRPGDLDAHAARLIVETWLAQQQQQGDATPS
ncbi:MAG: Holliday junction resolvase RuvX [Pseudomonadota bacterium]